MKVADIMQRKVDYVGSNTAISEVAKLIFGRGINGLPVVKNKKLVGFITEKDILHQFYPSITEYVEDPVNASDFEAMESKISEILSFKAEKIMSKNPVCIKPNTPVLKAQSLMFINKIGRLPVVDDKKNLVGILTKGDIFRAVVGNQLPLDQEADFYDWMSTYYDTFNNWDNRLAKEVPDLVKLFKKEKAKFVLDVGSSTGEHTIALAKEGFSVVGIDASKLMHKAAEKKLAKLPENLKKKIRFLEGNYDKVTKELPKNIDAAIFMGDALAHVMETDKDILKNVSSVLTKDKGLLVFQISNIFRFLRNKSGLKDFTIRDISQDRKEAFLTFYTDGKRPLAARGVFDFFSGKWVSRGIHTKTIINIDKEGITKELKKLGFSTITFYGSNNYDLFKGKFDKNESVWLNVVAKR